MGKLLVATQENVQILKFVGDISAILSPTITCFLTRIGLDKSVASIMIDLTETTSIDSTSLGLLVKISLKCKSKLDARPILMSTHSDVNRIIESMGFDQVFILVNQLPAECCDMNEVPTQIASEIIMRQQVLEAHQTLMRLNAKNHDCFCDLVEALKKE